MVKKSYTRKKSAVSKILNEMAQCAENASLLRPTFCDFSLLKSEISLKSRIFTRVSVGDQNQAKTGANSRGEGGIFSQNRPKTG